VARVLFAGALRRHVGGTAELEVEAGSYRDLVRALEERFPGFAELVDGRMALAVDGELISDPLLEPIDADSEVHFVPRISGGC
jgi:molybdopterin converting factor small subunit